MHKRGDVREAARIIAAVRADSRAAGLIDAELPAAGVLTGLLLREGRHREVIPVLLDSLRRLDERKLPARTEPDAADPQVVHDALRSTD